MGYPMTYTRVVVRNGLNGNYAEGRSDEGKLIAGDMRRLELDQRDQHHLRRYAEAAGITDHQAYRVLTAFFTDFGAVQTPWLAAPCWPDARSEPTIEDAIYGSSTTTNSREVSS